MRHKLIQKQDYDKKIKFHNKTLFCYSKEKLKTDNEEQSLPILGEIVKKGKNRDGAKVEVHSEWYDILKQGTKSRLLYKEAGYLQTENGSYVIVLKSRLLLFLFLAVLVIGILGFFFLRKPAVPVMNPLPIDPNESIIKDDDSEKKDSEEGGGAVTLTYSLDARLTLSSGNIKIYFLNPNASNHDISLALYLVEGENQIKIAESGRIQAGYGLTDMKFIEKSAKLSQGNYNGLFIVSFYHPETGEKALVESTITDVKVEVLP